MYRSGPCLPDRFEPNDLDSTASPIEPGVLTWIRMCPDEAQDTFSVYLEPFDHLMLTTSHLPGFGFTDLEVIELPTGPKRSSVAGAGDFDGDGRAELFWQKTNGDFFAWHLDPLWNQSQEQIANRLSTDLEPRAVAVHPPPGYVRQFHPGAEYLDTSHPDEKFKKTGGGVLKVFQSEPEVPSAAGDDQARRRDLTGAPDSQEQPHPQALQLGATDAVQAFTVVAAGELGQGAFIVFADDAIFQNRFLTGDNVTLARNLAGWLLAGVGTSASPAP